MSSVLMITENQLQINTVTQALQLHLESDFHIFPQPKLTHSGSRHTLPLREVHFLIFAKRLDKKALQELRAFHSRFPLTTIIYFYFYLAHCQFIHLNDCGVTSCIVGKRQEHRLVNTLKNLWQYHWKHIADHLLPFDRQVLSSRAQKTLAFIENHSLHDFNCEALADYLNISKSHFRAEFKHEFGCGVRTFKSKLIKYYESVLLYEYHLAPHEIYKCLDYHHISAYSRAFKIRHGKTWRDTETDVNKKQ